VLCFGSKLLDSQHSVPEIGFPGAVTRALGLGTIPEYG
jgi:hypothetical protein